MARLIDLILDEGGVFYRNASGALMLAYVASGRLLAYAEEHMNAWDCLAGMLLVEEAGGRILLPDPRRCWNTAPWSSRAAPVCSTRFRRWPPRLSRAEWTAVI